MKDMKTLEEVAEWLRDSKKRQTGIYYNAYSEDLFAWDNDMKHAEKEMRLKVVNSSLNRLHRDIDEGKIRALLEPYHVNYDFRFQWINDDPDSGIKSVSFFKAEDPDKNIKISRGEERLFVWTFIMALFMEENGHLGEHKYFFIDDPVGSLDDNNLFVTASRLVELMKENYKDSKIIVTTHHAGFFSTLTTLMKNADSGILSYTEIKDENGKKFMAKDPKYDIKFLERVGEKYTIRGNGKGLLQYHLLLLQQLNNVEEDEVIPLHFVQLRQILELISSFQGKGNFSKALSSAGVDEWKGVNVADRVNVLSHQRVYERALPVVSPQDRTMLKHVVEELVKTFKFEV